MADNNIAGNYYDKYNTTNPIARVMMKGFWDSLLQISRKIEIHNVLEAGCGEGEVSNFIKNAFPNISLRAFDIEETAIVEAKKRFPALDFSVESIYKIPYRENEFDLVIACEVLEHLIDPEKALSEISRVSNNYVLLSVPREPLWRILNMARGKYINDFGNTPGHIQHWSKKDFISLVSNYVEVVEILTPLPWTMLLCRVK